MHFEIEHSATMAHVYQISYLDAWLYQRLTQVQSKRHRLWFSTKTHVNSMILIHKLNLTLLRNIYIKKGLLSTTHILMYIFLNEVKFNLRIRITLFIWVFVKYQLHVFVGNHNLWCFDCTQCIRGYGTLTVQGGERYSR